MSLRLHHLHPWNLSPAEAQKLQEELRSYVIVQTPTAWQPRLVCGVDASFAPGFIRAAAIVLSYPALEPVDQAAIECLIEFPYIPGLLSFREAPAMLKALANLRRLPDVLFVDGHGRAHPRRFGIACHIGVLLDIPTIGCAKSLLIGAPEPLAQARGSQAKIIHEGEVIGAAVRTRTGVRPVYVSIGHRVDLPTAIQLVMSCGRGYRLPEPLRQAHHLAGITQRVHFYF